MVIHVLFLFTGIGVGYLLWGRPLARVYVRLWDAWERLRHLNMLLKLERGYAERKSKCNLGG